VILFTSDALQIYFCLLMSDAAKMTMKSDDNDNDDDNNNNNLIFI